MKTSIILIIFCLCSSLSAVSGKCEMNMPNDEQYISMTSQENMNNTYLSIQKGEYDNAYNSFIAGVDKNDKTLGGFIFETIVNGLRIFGHLKKFKIKDYGIPGTSIDAIKNIDKTAVISVFEAIHDIAHNPNKFVTKGSIAECFESIKQSREISLIHSSDNLRQENDNLQKEMLLDEDEDDDMSPIDEIKEKESMKHDFVKPIVGNTQINTTTEIINESILQYNSMERNETVSTSTKKPKAIKRSKGDVELTKPKKMIAKDINSQNIVGKCKTGATNVGHETRKRMKYSGEDGDSIVLPAKRKKEYT